MIVTCVYFLVPSSSVLLHAWVTYMDAKLAIVGHTNKHTTHNTQHTTSTPHQAHNSAGDEWLLVLAPFIVGVVRGDGDSWQ